MQRNAELCRLYDTPKFQQTLRGSMVGRLNNRRTSLHER